MSFASLSFLYYFLPVVVGVSCLLPRGKTNGARNWFLLGASVFFCVWTRGKWFTWPFVLVIILQAAAYLVGVCRREIQPRKSPLYLALYLLGSPWAMGPMMPYPVLERQLLARENTVPRFAEGLRRLVWGLCQKVILADTLWTFSQEVEKFGEAGVVLAWVRLAAVALAVYYALAGYGNLAIGLGKLLGFDLCELTAGPLLWLGNLTRKPGLDQRRGLRGIVWVLLILSGVLLTAGGCQSLSALFLPLLGGGDAGLLGEAGAYLLRSYAVPLILAVFFAAPWPARWVEALRRGKRTARVFAALEPVVLALLLLLGTAWLVDGAALTFLP